jgi:TadE-like protein
MASVLGLLRRWRSDSGAELIEFALAFPLLLLVVFGIIDFGFLFQQYEVVTNAAREGARIATLPDYQSAFDTNAQNRALEYLDAAGLNDPGREVLVSCASGLFTVTVRYPHNYSFVGGIVQYFSIGGGYTTTTLSSTSTMRAERAGGCP